MYQLAHVANTILYRAKKEGIAISPMKLQKLIYFTYADYLHYHKACLFAERFEAWKYGPVLDDVYQAFKEYGSNPIRSYMPDATGLRKVIDVDSDILFRGSFDRVWLTLSRKTGIELAKITHRESGAWYAAMKKKSFFLSDEDINREMDQKGNG